MQIKSNMNKFDNDTLLIIRKNFLSECKESRIIMEKGFFWKGAKGIDKGRKRAGECYENSRALYKKLSRKKDKCGKVFYVEGYAAPHIKMNGCTDYTMLPHVWVVDGDQVIDPTWGDNNGFYFGVLIDPEYLVHIDNPSFGGFLYCFGKESLLKDKKVQNDLS